MKKERTSKPRKMLPQYLVLCEGETEEAYVNLLKQKYRLPIKIVIKKIGSNISESVVNRYKKELACNPNFISTFFIYDGDVQSIIKRLSKCKGQILISKPCIEIWFLSHYKNISDVEISSEECVNNLQRINNWENYKKGFFSFMQQKDLWEKRLSACENMKSISNRKMAYSQLDMFIEQLESDNKNR